MTTVPMSNETSTLRLRVLDWLDSVDPGRLRFHNALRATMAMFTTWVIVYFVTPEMSWYFVGIGIFALMASFICDLVMYQVPTDNRFIALPLVFIPMVIALFLVAWTDNSPLWTAVSVILTFYLAYFLRRFGVLYFLLGFTAVTMFYVSFLLRVDQTCRWRYFHHRCRRHSEFRVLVHPHSDPTWSGISQGGEVVQSSRSSYPVGSEKNLRRRTHGRGKEEEIRSRYEKIDRIKTNDRDSDDGHPHSPSIHVRILR